MKRGRVVLFLSLALLALAAFFLARPLAPHDLASHPRPARDVDEALRIVDSLRSLDGTAVATECGTELLSHGGRTRRVIVMLHGLTNCPAQFDSLGRLSFARGANVLIPRLPRHGYANRMTTELARLNARELCAFTDRVIDAARGLGDSITVVGLSIGGVMAGWAAQERADVDRAVLIAPIFGVSRAPGAWTPVVARLAGAAPNVFVWWDDKHKQNLGGPKHVYPRFATRAVAATLYVGAAVRSAAARNRAACRSVALVTVGGDDAADNGLAAEVLQSWRDHGTPGVIHYHFRSALHLSHDVVDPEQVGGNPSITYPVLTRLIGP
jgi:pimeloyl-ACP methyl ester carboxylesterase